MQFATINRERNCSKFVLIMTRLPAILNVINNKCCVTFRPLKRIFPESKRGGEVDVMFPKTKVPKIFRNTTFPRKCLSSAHNTHICFIFNKFCNSSMPGAPPHKLGPLFKLFLGYTPPPPHTHTHPGGTALISSEKLDHISLPRKGLHTRLHYSGSILYDNAERDRQRLGASLHAPGLRS